MDRKEIVRARPPLLLVRTSAYSQTKSEYEQLYASVTVDEDRAAAAESQVKKLIAGRSRYQAVGEKLGIPWSFVGVIHGLEGGFNFTTHLHNGDPLTKPTTHVPAGRPPGPGPFTWEQSAIDALTMKDYDGLTDWSIARQLWRLERYNGTGYRVGDRPPTPYLWSGSNHERAGKFVADGSYDPTAVSAQIGAAVLLKLLSAQTTKDLPAPQPVASATVSTAAAAVASAPARPASGQAAAPAKPVEVGLPVLRLTETPLRGLAVIGLQHALSDHGYVIDVDGIFGNDTDRAVKTFQADRNLTVDGVVGEGTWTTLLVRTV